MINYRKMELLKQETEKIMTKGLYFRIHILDHQDGTKEKTHKTLAKARAKCKPHLFIIMTCNSNHPHILAALDESMKPSDRPDIVA